MNFRRGLNRLFVVAWAVWVLVAVGWGMNFVSRDRAAWDDLIYEGEHGRPLDPAYRATDAELANWRKQREGSTFMGVIHQFVTTADGLRLLALFFVVGPVIVYAALFVTGWAAGWIYRGFRA
jgi:hypothetical protein